MNNLKLNKHCVYLQFFIYICNCRNCYERNWIENMKFYNRTSELAELQRIQNLSYGDLAKAFVLGFAPTICL